MYKAIFGPQRAVWVKQIPFDRGKGKEMGDNGGTVSWAQSYRTMSTAKVHKNGVSAPKLL
jgi:hypothetical protein